ncbi:sensor histidine kinase [Hymenobacter latericus]|uniref:sensor histidine kinase n=1 Tax=Hymenobacter sp. YIM 151858-1 TaxID=2987688 RepID=UPI0022260037|nr:PAS domain-containing protein [Hymenobacter sp. YIM 151858-1]UYZ59184.1 PAS domain-containing protein [Hymenobacter sp. YIM 151858-1]
MPTASSAHPTNPVPAQRGADVATGFDTMFDTMPWGVQQLAADGTLVLVSRAAEAFWGLSREVLVGNVPWQAFPEALPAPLHQALQQALRQPGTPEPAVFWLPATHCYISMSSAPAPNGGVWVYWQDVTEQQQQVQQYQALVDNTPDAITRWDEELRLVFSNRAYQQKTGRPLAWLLHKTNHEMGQPEAVAGPWAAKLQRVLDTGVPQEHYNSFVTPEGGVAHYFTRMVPELRNGRVHTVLAIARDITELREQVYFTEKITNSTPDLLYVLELSEPHITYINERVEVVLGSHPSEVTAAGAMVLRNALHPDDLGRRMAHIEACRNLADDEVKIIDVRFRVADGAYRWFRLRDRAFMRAPDGRVTHVIGSGQDIDAQRAAERELQESKAFIEEVTKSTPDLITIHDAATNRVVYVNHTEPWYGQHALPVLHTLPDAERVRLLIHPADQDKANEYMQQRRLLADGDMIEVELRSQFGNTEWQWLRIRSKVFRRSASGQPQQIISFTSNITAAKLAQQALQQAHGQLTWASSTIRRMLDGSPAAICLMEAHRDATGRIVDFIFRGVNQAAEKLNERTEAELLNRGLLDFFPNVRQVFFDDYVRVVETGEPLRTERCYTGENFSNRWFDVSAVKNGDGFIMTFLDITGRKEIELALQQANTRLQHLSGAVLQAQEVERQRIAESLHNGLGQVLYAAKLQLDQLPSPQALADAPRQAAARREADRLLAEAIRLTRSISHELTPRIVAELGLEAALQDICRSLSTGLLHMQCLVLLDDDLPLTLQVALYRLAQELAQNIVKHAGATEATLEVATRPGWVVMQIEDNGRGFAPDEPTTGIGLKTLRDRVDLLGGITHISTSARQGTRIQVRIPLA